MLHTQNISVTCVTTEKLKTAVSYATYESSVNYVMTRQKSIHEIVQQSLHYTRTTRDSVESTNSLILLEETPVTCVTARLRT